MKPYPFWRSIAYVDHATKRRWHSQAMAKLRVLAKELGLERGEYDLRSNFDSIAVSGEVTLHGDHVYVQVSQPFQSGKGVLYRRCGGRRDYTGDRNHFATLDLLNDPDKLAGHIERDVGPVYKFNANEVA